MILHMLLGLLASVLYAHARVIDNTLVERGPGGSFTTTISAGNAVALHIGAEIPVGSPSGQGPTGSPSSVTVNFAETATTIFGDNIFLVGSIAQLGTWDPNTAIALSSADYPVWTVSLSLPANTAFEYKFVRKTAAGGIVWESGPNRSDTTPESGTQTLDTSWS